jgi:hypothetical protein
MASQTIGLELCRIVAVRRPRAGTIWNEVIGSPPRGTPEPRNASTNIDIANFMCLRLTMFVLRKHSYYVDNSRQTGKTFLVSLASFVELWHGVRKVKIEAAPAGKGLEHWEGS